MKILSILVLSVSVVGLFSTPLYADHTEAHCTAQTGSSVNADFDACLEDIPQTDTEKGAYCTGRTGSDTNADFDACINELGGFSSSNQNTPTQPSEGGETVLDPQRSGTLEPAELADNPIYERLGEILRVLSVGVGIVVTISVVIAGFQYMVSRGEPAKTQAAVNRLVQAGVALFLYVFGTAILNWIVPGGVFFS